MRYQEGDSGRFFGHFGFWCEILARLLGFRGSGVLRPVSTCWTGHLGQHKWPHMWDGVLDYLEAKLVLRRNPGVKSDSYTFFPSRSTHKCGSRLPITLEMSDFDEK